MKIHTKFQNYQTPTTIFISNNFYQLFLHLTIQGSTPLNSLSTIQKFFPLQEINMLLAKASKLKKFPSSQMIKWKKKIFDLGKMNFSYHRKKKNHESDMVWLWTSPSHYLFHHISHKNKKKSLFRSRPDKSMIKSNLLLYPAKSKINNSQNVHVHIYAKLRNKKPADNE